MGKASGRFGGNWGASGVQGELGGAGSEDHRGFLILPTLLKTPPSPNSVEPWGWFYWHSLVPGA